MWGCEDEGEDVRVRVRMWGWGEGDGEGEGVHISCDLLLSNIYNKILPKFCAVLILVKSDFSLFCLSSLHFRSYFIFAIMLFAHFFSLKSPFAEMLFAQRTPYRVFLFEKSNSNFNYLTNNCDEHTQKFNTIFFCMKIFWLR